jgi:YaiO family outer membrane protein
MRWTTIWTIAALGAAPAQAAAQAAPPPAAVRPAPAPPLVQAVEVGGGFGAYDNGFGASNQQFLRYRVSRTDDFSFSADLGREQRFGDVTLRGGVIATKSLANGLTFNAAWSAGSGDVIAPRYRFDLGVTQPIHGVLTTVTYTRLQSKTVNASDAYTIGAVRWFSRWIVQGYGRIEVGSPGHTVSTSAMVGATWYRWKKIYVGADLAFGHVSYVLLPRNAVAVNYKSIEGDVVVSRWFDERSGVNVRASFGDTDIYHLAQFTLSVFRQF